VLRSEGLASALDRARDRVSEWREARGARPGIPGAFGDTPVLNVLGFPWVARLGGVPLQLRRRLAQEAHTRATATLSRTPEGWRLERWQGPEPEALTWNAPSPASPVLEDGALEDAIARALEETGARAVHFEGLAGLAPRSVARVLTQVAARGVARIVTVHDFTPFCPRPHLWEQPAARFCDFSRDAARCHLCLSVDFDVARGFEQEWRAAMADALFTADALVFPSAYLQAAWRDLLPGLDPGRQHVIEPGAPSCSPVRAEPSAGVRRVALVGAVKPAKGAALLPEIVRDAGGLEFVVLGGGDAAILRALRQVPRTRVRGYYRAGSLAGHLRGVDVALLLSLVPESYGLTLDECWQAGVPVIAFDHGAVAERVRRLGGGLLVPLARGAAGVAEALRALREGATPRPAAPDPASLPTPGAAADAHLALYRRLVVLP
jgi:glycosyltransferase involved in cell wall biosynthesis